MGFKNYADSLIKPSTGSVGFKNYAKEVVDNTKNNILKKQPNMLETKNYPNELLGDPLMSLVPNPIQDIKDNRINADVDKLSSEAREIKKVVDTYNSWEIPFANGKGRTYQKSVEARQNAITAREQFLKDAGFSSIEDAESSLKQKQNYASSAAKVQTIAQERQKMAELSDYVKTPEYEENFQGYNRFIAEKENEQKKTSTFPFIDNAMLPDSFYGVAIKNYANASKNAKNDVTQYKVTDDWSVTDKAELAKLYSESPEKAMEFAKIVNTAIKNEEYRKTGEEHLILSSIASVPVSVLSSVDYLRNLVEYGTDKIMGRDAKLERSALSDLRDSLRQGVTDGTDWKIGNFDAFDFLYGVGMSTADMAAASMLGGGVNAITSKLATKLGTSVGGKILGKALTSIGSGSVLGLSAASSTMNDVLDRGGTDAQALTSGLVAGAFETLFESLSIGEIKSMGRTSKEAFKELIKKSGKENVKILFKRLGVDALKSMGTNATEEAATELANVLYDTFANGDVSNYAIMVENYMKEDPTLTEEEARDKAIKQFTGQVLESAASGAIMGLFLGNGATVKAYMGAKTETGYKSASVNTKVLDLISKVKSGNFKANDKVYLESVTPDVAQQIKEITGVDVSDFKVVFEARQIDHIIKDHGTNGKADRSMSNDVDIAKIEYVLKSPDSIVSSGTTNAYVSNVAGKNKPAQTVLYEKVLGDDSYYAVQAVPVTKSNTLYIVSAFMGKGGYKKETSQTSNANSPGATPNSENASVSSDSTVTQRIQSVKNNISNQSGNNASIFNLSAANPKNDIVGDAIAKSSGVPNRSADQRTLQRLGRAFGTKIEFADLDYTVTDENGNQKVVSPEGSYNRDTNTITLNTNVKDNHRPVLFVLKHELTHSLEKTGVEYEKFMAEVEVSNEFEAYAKKRGFETTDAWYQSIIDKYARAGKPLGNESESALTAAKKEAVADFVGDVLFDGRGVSLENLLNSLQPETKKTFIEKVKEVLAKLKSIFVGKPELTEIEALEKRFLEVANKVSEMNKTETEGKTGQQKTTTDEGVKFSLSELDREYMSAVESGDIETAQRLVDEAAREAGYDSPKLYHGTQAFGFTRVKTSGVEKGVAWSPFFAANKEDISASYVLYGKVRDISSSMDDDAIEEARENAIEERKENISELVYDFRRLIDRHFSPWVFGQTDNSYLEELVEKANPEAGYGDGVYDVLSEVVYDSFYDYQDEFGEYEDADDWAENSPEGHEIFSKINEIEGEKSALHRLELGEELGGIYQLYANLDNMYVVDGKGVAWNELRPEGLPKIERYGVKDAAYRTRDVAEWARDNGSDGVIFKNIRDNGAYGRTPPGDVYVFFRPESQVKSADPVTYDDNGNIIPLSERFKRDNNDIRYSLPPDATVEQVGDAYKNGEISKEEFAAEMERLFSDKVSERGAIKQGEQPKPIRIGSKVRVSDRNNIGTVLNFDNTTNEYTVRFVAKDGATATKKFPKSAVTELNGISPTVKPVPTPKSVSDGTLVRRHARTILESGYATPEMEAYLKELILEGDYSYFPTSNKKSIAKAERNIENQGYQNAVSNWQRSLSKSTVDADTVATGEALLKMAFDQHNAVDIVNLTADLAELGTRMGQAVQAFSLLKRMGGISQLVYLQRSVNKINEDLKQRFKGSKKDAPVVKMNEKLAERLAKAETEGEKEVIYGRIVKDIADQVPSTFLDKWNAWRYMAMLFNPTTHIRNVLGNGIFLPVVRMKDLIALGGEKIFVKAEDRTKVLKVKQEYQDFAEKDFLKIEPLLTGTGKYNPSDNIRDEMTVFKNKILEGLRKFNFTALEKEDAIFLRKHYRHALGSFLQAKNIDLKNMSNAQLLAAREYAFNEALKATYRDASKVANMLSQLSKTSKFANVLVEGVLPFKKTPINILKRGVEYSPIGIIKTLSKGIYDLKKGEFNAAQFIDGLAANAIGSIPFVIGMFLANLGIAKGGFDDEEEIDKLMGKQEYSIQIGDTSYTIDWLAPASIPFFMGVAISEYESDEDGDFLSNLYDFGIKGFEPILNLSMLSGVNDMIDSVSYAEDAENLPQLIGSGISSYFSQALPTIFGKTSNIFDNTKRTRYVDKTSNVPEIVQKALDKIASKTPFASKSRAEYVDAWGETKYTGNFFQRFFQQFVSPGYASTVDQSAISEECLRLYRETGEKSVVPSTPAKYFTLKGNRRDLSKEEYYNFATFRGQMSADLVNEAINNAEYQKLTDEQKAEVITDIYDYVGALAKSQLSYSYEEIAAMEGGEDVLTPSRWNKLNDKAKQLLVNDYFLDGTKGKAYKQAQNGKSVADFYIKKVKSDSKK